MPFLYSARKINGVTKEVHRREQELPVTANCCDHHVDRHLLQCQVLNISNDTGHSACINISCLQTLRICVIASIVSSADVVSSNKALIISCVLHWKKASSRFSGSISCRYAYINHIIIPKYIFKHGRYPQSFSQVLPPVYSTYPQQLSSKKRPFPNSSTSVS